MNKTDLMTLGLVVNPFSNLVELIKANAKLEEELEELKEHLKGMRFWKYLL